LARQVGWDSQQSDFNYAGGQVIGLAAIILIPMGGEYAKTVSATAGLRSAAGLLDDAIGGTGNGTGSKLPPNDAQIKHIFRDDVGHIADTPANRNLLEGVAQSSQNYLGTDMYGLDWYGKIQHDGSQVWVRSYNGTIRDGGINNAPRQFDPKTGLNNNPFSK
jgi:hypothetical protein